MSVYPTRKALLRPFMPALWHGIVSLSRQTARRVYWLTRRRSQRIRVPTAGSFSYSSWAASQ